MKRIIIVGGGASGMMAAISASEEGADVTILEHNDRIGKKILSTGNGRCNFTNTAQEPIFYRSENPGFPWEVLSEHNAQETILHFTKMGIYSKNKGGYLYPNSEQASAVLDVLRMELNRLGVKICCEEHVEKIEPAKKGFRIVCKYGKERKETHRYECDKVILSTGSKAAPVSGSDGSGYTLAKSMGHHLKPVLPSLVQLRCKESFYKALAGVRIQGKVSIFADGELQASDTGEIQLTNYGISGIPVFQVSRYAAIGIYRKQEVFAVLDFMPEFNEEQFLAFVKNRIGQRPQKTMEEFFIGLFNKKVAQVLLKVSGISDKKCGDELKEAELIKLVKSVKGFKTQVIETNSFVQAQVCAGGVDTEEINPQTMESKLVPGLFVTGELLDVDGICGGYNLQWAWSSGYLAGKGAANA